MSRYAGSGRKEDEAFVSFLNNPYDLFNEQTEEAI